MARLNQYDVVKTTFADTPAIDAFSRLRVGEPYGLFDGKLLHADNPLLWSDATTSGTAGSTYSANTSSVTLDVTAETGTRVRQTKQRFNYQPGKSQLIFVTFTLGAAVANVTKRVGYFDDDNGLFLQQTAAGLAFVKRSKTSGTAVDTVVYQQDWNLNRLDFTDVYQRSIDATASQILVIDFEWLGVGRVRIGFVIDGQIVYCHEWTHSNHTAGVYMTTPNLPIRYELSSSADATATLECICSSVMSEGGYNPPGIQYAIDRGITGFVTDNNTSIYPVLAFRLNSAYKGARLEISAINLICTSTANYRWALLLNPDVTGTALSFAAVTNTACEAATGATNATTVSGGLVLASGYGADTASARTPITWDTSSRLAPGFAVDGTADVIVLAVQNLTAAAETYFASLSINEVS